MKHGAKFAFANFLASAFIFLGKIGLTTLNIFLTYLFMKEVTGSASDISDSYAPLVLVGLTTYIICSVFLGLFDESVMAMMTCMTVDMDLPETDGNACRWGPQSLQDVMDEFEGPVQHKKDPDANDIN